MKYIYILLICLVIFYLVSIIYQKNITKENFDPSLVPVPAIVTLANVVQNISDKLGTLINPGNLSIGSYAATAFTNLLVTGNTVINPANGMSNTPNLSVNKDEIVLGNFTNNSLIPTSSINALLANLNGPSTTVTNFNSTNLNVNGNATINGMTTVMNTPASQINIGKANNAANLLALNIANNDVRNSGNSTITGFLQYPNLIASDLNIAGTLNTGGTYFTKNFSNKSSATTSEISNDAALMIVGNYAYGNGKRNITMLDNVTVTGNFTIGKNSTVDFVKAGSIMMWPNTSPPNGWALCHLNGLSSDILTNPKYSKVDGRIPNLEAQFLSDGPGLSVANPLVLAHQSPSNHGARVHRHNEVYGVYFIIKL
jgi:hypothetical protein